MTVSHHPTHPDELRRELREREQIAFVYGATFHYSSAPPECRTAMDRGAASAGLPIPVYAPIFAKFMHEISLARAALIREQLERLTSKVQPPGE